MFCDEMLGAEVRRLAVVAHANDAVTSDGIGWHGREVALRLGIGDGSASVSGMVRGCSASS